MKELGLKVLVNGTNSANKGAELMLYAIIQEIERTHPTAKLIYNDLSYKSHNKKTSYFHTSLHIIKPVFRSVTLTNLLQKLHIYGVLRRLQIDIDNYPTTFYKPNLFLDASGYFVTDKWDLSKSKLRNYKKFLVKLKKNKTKIVFMPQAFGPIEKENTKQLMQIMYDNADLIFVRDLQSYEFIHALGYDMQKITLSPDFTSTVKGESNQKYEKERNYICIIPNQRMIDKVNSNDNTYLNFLSEMIKICKNKDKQIYLLNHESKQDERICVFLSKKFKIPFVTGLNALEVKAFISNAFLVISSRFHGVASSLNSCVPCLATSWSHKYEELFKDYAQEDCIMNIEDINDSLNKLQHMLNVQNNQKVREILFLQKEKQINKVEGMWKQIWSLLNI